MCPVDEIANGEKIGGIPAWARLDAASAAAVLDEPGFVEIVIRERSPILRCSCAAGGFGAVLPNRTLLRRQRGFFGLPMSRPFSATCLLGSTSMSFEIGSQGNILDDEEILALLKHDSASDKDFDDP
jgi:hypothetical protein